MSRMLCKCGASMGTSVSPSPYNLFIYKEEEIQTAIAENSSILLTDFLTDWDAVNEKQKEFMKRSESIEYWYCTECHRVYETQLQIGGHWLRVYQLAEHQAFRTPYAGWTRIYVFTETDTDAVLEKDPQLLLSDYLKTLADIHYLLSPDEKNIVVLSASDNSIKYVYTQEEINTMIE